VINTKRKIFLIIASLLVFSCSTKKNTLTSRSYHNLTARYNVYFNGKESYKAGLKKIQESYKENYNEIIPVFNYDNLNALKSGVSDMDKAIVKSTKLIKNHSITAKPKQVAGDLSEKQKEFYAKKEYCNWVDNAYMLMGKAYLHKEDYYSSNKNFDFVVREYKKEPVFYPASLWSVRARIQMGNFEDAQNILDKLLIDPLFPEKYKGEHCAIYADLLIKQKRYKDAITKLEDAIKLTIRKKTKIRYTYILAQLYSEIGDKFKATELFEKVIAMNPDYDMSFNAKINLATSYSGSGDSKDIMKILKKLLRDSKNKEFQDQIYFAMANIEQQNKNEEAAINYYKQSIAKSESNDYQKAMPFLAIGKIYYDKKLYVKSQPYYDSCVISLEETHKDYLQISSRAKNLNELALNYNIVYTEDSLQRVAKMDKTERDKFIEKIIEDVKKEEELKRQLEEERQLNSLLYNQDFGYNNQKASGKWYFYNPSMLTFGKGEFIKRWGSRKLEDDWRRKNKSVSKMSDFVEEDDENDSIPKEPKLSKTSVAYYTRNLPLTDSAINVSSEKIKDAMFNMGMVLMDKIVDNKEAIVAFEDFTKRWQGDDIYMPMVYYYLYKLYQEEANFAKSLEYKNLIVTKFPESKYAQALTNPNYFRELKFKEQQVEKYYSKAFRSYYSQDYNSVMQICSDVKKEYPNNNYNEKFDFLEAMSLGKTTGTSGLKKSLKNYIEFHPNGQLDSLAKSILTYLENSDEEDLNQNLYASTSDNLNVTTETVQKKIEEEIYFFNDNVKHLFVIASDNENVNVNRLKFNVINYNLDFFSNFDFDIGMKELNKKTNLIVVKFLSDNQQAFNYYQLVNISDEIFEGIDKTHIKFFIINEKNYDVLCSDKNIQKYIDFFNDFYLR